MASVDPVPDEPAATTLVGDEHILLIADYHAGIEAALRDAGVELDSRGPDRRRRLTRLISETGADRVVVLGDLGHTVGEPNRVELNELETLLEELSVPMTLVPGNHDAGLGEALDITVTDVTGTRLGDLGLVHGHSWPSPAILSAATVCMGHEHPMVRLEDEVGGSHVERVWLRGPLAADPFDAQGIETELGIDAELVVVPAFNDLSGGTWVNVAEQEFLSPFLPDALPDGRAYLLDGTDLGTYRGV